MQFNNPSPERRFLENFEDKRRSLIASLFYSAVRSGIEDPGAVVAEVRSELQRRRAKRAFAADADGLRREQELGDAVTAVLNSDPQAGLDFAAAVVSREAMPAAEFTKLKEEQSGHYRGQWMAGQPATEKQISLLKKLGYTGPILNRLQASLAIDALLQVQKGGGR